MLYHQNLEEIVNASSKLLFETKYAMSKTSEDNGFLVDVKIHKYCNKMSLEEFKTTFLKEIGSVYSSLSKNHKAEDILSVIISLSILKGNLFRGTIYVGTEVEEPANDLNENEAYKNGAMDYNTITDMKESKEDFYNIILKEIDYLLEKLSALILPKEQSFFSKMEWNANPAPLAFLLNELFSKGWLNMPITNSDPSHRKMASLCNDIFLFNGTERSLYNAFKDSHSLLHEKKSNFNIPRLKDMQ